MPGYGYHRAVVDTEYGLLELREVSFSLSPDELRRVANFLRHCADSIDAGDWRSDHAHLVAQDHEWRQDHPGLDFVVLHDRGGGVS
jgi:hypothetical protein